MSSPARLEQDFPDRDWQPVNNRQTLFQTTRFTAKVLSPADLDLVLELNQKSVDFFLLQNGVPPTRADALELFEAVPANCDRSSKLAIGIFAPDETLAGVLDILRGYRTAGDWYIGLMLLAPAFQNQGFGSEIHQEFTRYVRGVGIRLLIAVLEGNQSARRFWIRLGYRKVKDHPPRQCGIRFHALTEFEMIIGESAESARC